MKNCTRDHTRSQAFFEKGSQNIFVYEIFAGGNRLRAAQQSGLQEIPLVVHKGYSDEELVRLATEDNENDEYHVHVPKPDVWAEYAKLKELWGSGRKVAQVKGVHEAIVSDRIRWNKELPQEIREKVSNDILEEGHIREIFSIIQTFETLFHWLTTSQAQIEFTEQLLDKHRGSSAGIKPTVKHVRAKAKEWKAMITYAQECYQQLHSHWQHLFVELLVQYHSRTKASIQKAYQKTLHEQEEDARAKQAAARRQQEQAEQDSCQADPHRARDCNRCQTHN